MSPYAETTVGVGQVFARWRAPPLYVELTQPASAAFWTKTPGTSAAAAVLARTSAIALVKIRITFFIEQGLLRAPVAGQRREELTSARRLPRLRFRLSTRTCPTSDTSRPNWVR